MKCLDIKDMGDSSMENDFGKLVSEHKTSLWWLIKRRAAFYGMALLLFSFPIADFILGPEYFAENIDIWVAFSAIGVIFPLLSIRYTKSFKAAIYERGFILTFGFTKKKVEMSFNELSGVYWQEEAKYEYFLGGTLEQIGPKLLIGVFVGWAPRIYEITLLKQNGVAIDLKSSRNNDYRQFIMDLDAALQEWCAGAGQKISKEAIKTIRAWEKKAKKSNNLWNKLKYVFYIACGVFFLVAIILVMQGRMALV